MTKEALTFRFSWWTKPIIWFPGARTCIREITKGAVLSLRKLLRENGIKLKQFQEVLNYFEEYEKETNPGDFFVRELNEEFVGAVERLVSLAERKLGEKKDVKNKAEIVRILLDFSRFYKMSDFFDEDYVYTVGRTEKNLRIAVNCLDASKFLLRTIKERTAGAVFFSATLYPSAITSNCSPRGKIFAFASILPSNRRI